MRNFKFHIPFQDKTAKALPSGWQINSGNIESEVFHTTSNLDLYWANLRKCFKVCPSTLLGLSIDVNDLNLSQFKNLCKRYLKFERALDMVQPSVAALGWPEYGHFNLAYEDIDTATTLGDLIRILNAAKVNFKLDAREYIVSGHIMIWHQVMTWDSDAICSFVEAMQIFIDDSVSTPVRKSAKVPKPSNLLVGLFAPKGFKQLQDGNRRHLYGYFKSAAQKFHPELMAA